MMSILTILVEKPLPPETRVEVTTATDVARGSVLTYDLNACGYRYCIQFDRGTVGWFDAPFVKRERN